MKFGKLHDIKQTDFSLPKTNFLFKDKPSENFQIYVGAPKWGVKEWVGRIYPPKTPAKRYLSEYAKCFNTIELNTTFYRAPTKELVLNWQSQVGENFKFCPKVPSGISHYGKLESKVLEMQDFVRTVYQLKQNLGIVFLQLHDSYAKSREEDLKKFIKKMNGYLFAVELRHESWFAGDRSFFDFSADNNVSVVITDVLGRRDVAHMNVTAKKVMIRFGGNELDKSDFERLDVWIQKIREMKDNGVEEVYFFMHQPEELLLPELSEYFIEKWNKNVNIKLENIVRYDL